MHQELKIHVPDTSTITINNQETLEQATSTLSQLNTYLDQVTAHKEAKTKPLNSALKAIRDDYRPLETQLAEAIQSVRQSITTYATEQAKIAIQQEQAILNDKRTKLTTKVQQLAEIEQPTAKVSTAQGSITFMTVKRWKLTDITKVPIAFLQVNEEAIKQAMKEGIPVEGIEYYEEQTLRNYR